MVNVGVGGECEGGRGRGKCGGENERERGGVRGGEIGGRERGEGGEGEGEDPEGEGEGEWGRGEGEVEWGREEGEGNGGEGGRRGGGWRRRGGGVGGRGERGREESEEEGWNGEGEREEERGEREQNNNPSSQILVWLEMSHRPQNSCLSKNQRKKEMWWSEAGMNATLFVLSSLLCYTFLLNLTILFYSHTTHSCFCFEQYLHIGLQWSLRGHLRVNFWAGPRESLEETGLLCLVHDNMNHYIHELSDTYQSCLLPKILRSALLESMHDDYNGGS